MKKLFDLSRFKNVPERFLKSAHVSDDEYGLVLDEIAEMTRSI
jgi:hypothetical protein